MISQEETCSNKNLCLTSSVRYDENGVKFEVCILLANLGPILVKKSIKAFCYFIFVGSFFVIY